MGKKGACLSPGQYPEGHGWTQDAADVLMLPKPVGLQANPLDQTERCLLENPLCSFQTQSTLGFFFSFNRK